MKYAFVRRHCEEYSVVGLCSVLGVSMSGYYDWRDPPEWTSHLSNSLTTRFQAPLRKTGNDKTQDLKCPDFLGHINVGTIPIEVSNEYEKKFFEGI